MKRALFIDRDGVINRMVHYAYGWDSPQRPKDVQLVPNITSILRWANAQNIPVIQISNQPGIAKGKLSVKMAANIDSRIRVLLQAAGTRIDASYICPHHPDAILEKLRVNCDCRKPKAGLIFNASKDLDIYLTGSVFLGDKATDIQAGQVAQTKTILYVHSDDDPEKVKALATVKPDYKISKMSEALPILKKIFR